jgi:hypothetical protein
MNATLEELAQRLRVAEMVLACQEHNPAHLALIRRTIARYCPPLTYGGKR